MAQAKPPTDSASKSRKAYKLATVCGALEKLAPLELAQSWDNVGLLAGDSGAAIRKVLLCIDLMPAVVDEAIRGKFELVVAYHPPIFKPITRLTAPSHRPEADVFRCIAAGTAVYSTHTALDAADGGTNDVIAEMCGVQSTEPLEYAQPSGAGSVKFVVFVPTANLDAVTDAMFNAGAGRIGEYQKCSYRIDGTGTFEGSDATHPAVGKSGQFETVAETRVEMVCPMNRVPHVHAAMVAVHPYEEPAFDIYPVQTVESRGIGRVGALPKPVELGALARKLQRSAEAATVQIVGDGSEKVNRAIILVGAAGSLPFAAKSGPGDVIITGEIRHHDALAIRRAGANAIALNHWSSERPVLASFAKRLESTLPGIAVSLSSADSEPFAPATTGK